MRILKECERLNAEVEDMSTRLSVSEREGEDARALFIRDGGA